MYGRFLDLPDCDLACTRQTLEADLRDPRRTIYERRRLYEHVLRVLLANTKPGMHVLDYGCGTGDWGLMLAGQGAQVTLLDLSPVAMQLAERRASASGVAGRVRTVAADASDLRCFGDAEFDLIYASAAVHHTLKYPHAFEELLRVLRPGGRLILAETFGNNTLLNLARRLSWRLRRLPEEAGEDILFSQEHVDLLRRHFQHVELLPLNLLAMLKRVFRGRFTSRTVRGIVRGLEVADRVLFRVCPPLRRYCGEVVVVAVK